jgi:hypothetical protein
MLLLKDYTAIERNTWRKSKKDKMIKNCIDNKYVNKQIVKKKTGGGEGGRWSML